MKHILLNRTLYSTLTTAKIQKISFMQKIALFIVTFLNFAIKLISNTLQYSPLLGIKIIATVTKILDQTKTTAVESDYDKSARSITRKDNTVTTKI